MPIYAYRCGQCGHELDALQKLSEPVLVDCPSCGAPALAKLVTAAGFQLKGSGWYQTDFRGGNKPAAKDAKEAKGSEPASDTAAASPPADGKSESKAAKPAATDSAATPSAPASSSGSGTGSGPASPSP